MNIVFMGTPEFCVPSLNSLVNAGHHIIGVVTQPDKPKGRGKEVQFTPVKQAALAYKFPVYQPIKVKDEEFVSQLRNLNPDVIVVIAFGQLLSKEILELPKYGCINIHASLLPKYRGAAPIQWAIIHGEKQTGITTMYMDQGLDTGDILDSVSIPIEDSDTGGSLHDKLSIVGSELILQTLEKLERGTMKPIKQVDALSNYAIMINKKLGLIDFSMKAIDIERLIRGLNPWPSAYTNLNNKTLKMWEATVIEKDYPGNYGEIVEITKDLLIIKTKEKALGLTCLQLEGKKRMQVSEFLRGYTLSIGQQLGCVRK